MDLTQQLGKTTLYGDIALSPDGTHSIKRSPGSTDTLSSSSARFVRDGVRVLFLVRSLGMTDHGRAFLL
jgi:hypothetical protein